MGRRRRKKNNHKLLLGMIISASVLFVAVIIFVVVLIAGSGKKNNEEESKAAERPSESFPVSTEIKATESQTEEEIVVTSAETKPEEKISETPAETEQESTAALREPQTISIVAVGDNLIHSQIYESILRADGTYDFSGMFDTNLINEMKSADLTIVNQETPACGNALGVSTYPRFNAPTEAIDALVDMLGADVLTLATNHACDKGEAGIVGTLGYIHTAHPGVLTTGTYATYEDSVKTPIIEVKGAKIAVLNYTYGTNGLAVPHDHSVNLLDDKVKMAQDFDRAREEADFIIAAVHWGVEYSQQVSAQQREDAKYLAELGADLILGAHPHVAQPLELIVASDGREVPVFYSLGNFLSAQNLYPRTLGEMAKINLYVDEYGKVTMLGFTCDFTATYYTVSNEFVFGNFKNYMLRDYPIELEASSGIKMWSPEFSIENYKNIARSINPNWN